jgi:ferritin-like metal-binding protein YciE
MNSSLDQVKTWLNSAYAMEQSLAQVLKNHASDAREDYPEVQSRIEEHLAETERHAERVKNCLQLLGDEPSTTKSAIGNIMGMVQGASTGMYRDEIVKNALADYASEHFEIACYRSLIAAAEEIGRTEIADVCREILRDEESMAQWYQLKIPEITRTFLQRAEMARA